MSVNDGLIAITAAVGGLSIASALVAIYQKHMRRHAELQWKRAESVIRRARKSSAETQDVESGPRDRDSHETHVAHQGNSILAEGRSAEPSDRSACGKVPLSRQEIIYSQRFSSEDARSKPETSKISEGVRRSRQLNVNMPSQESRGRVEPRPPERTPNARTDQSDRKPAQYYAPTTQSLSQPWRPAMRSKSRFESPWCADGTVPITNSPASYATMNQRFAPYQMPGSGKRRLDPMRPVAKNMFRNGSIAHPARYSHPRAEIYQDTSASMSSAEDFSEHSRSRATSAARHVATTPSDLISTFDTSPLHAVQHSYGQRNESHPIDLHNYASEGQHAERSKASGDSRPIQSYGKMATQNNQERQHESDSESQGTESVVSKMTEQGAFGANRESQKLREMLEETAQNDSSELVNHRLEGTHSKSRKNSEEEADSITKSARAESLYHGQQW